MRKFIQSLLPKPLVGYLSSHLYRPFKSYSGGGEDVVINRLFQGRQTGFFVDVGCFHPVVVSNTHLLYRRGWRGINIDADQYKVDVFNRTRKRDRNICAAISDREGEAEFFFHSGETYGSMSGLDQVGAERRARALGRKVLSRMVVTRPLSAILQEEGVSKIDFLTVDVEGAEDLVLSTLNFHQIEVDVIAVEIHGDFDSVMKSTSFQFLIERGFDFVAWTPPTVFMRRSDI